MEPARVVFYHRIYFLYTFDVLVKTEKYNVAAVFMELGLPTLSTLVHNAKFRNSLHVLISLCVWGRCYAVLAPSQPSVMPACALDIYL